MFKLTTSGVLPEAIADSSIENYGKLERVPNPMLDQRKLSPVIPAKAGIQ
jgi:hypothetical protein